MVPEEGLEPPLFVWQFTKLLLSPLSHSGKIGAQGRTRTDKTLFLRQIRMPFRHKGKIGAAIRIRA